jgi:hypothetical protein
MQQVVSSGPEFSANSSTYNNLLAMGATKVCNYESTPGFSFRGPGNACVFLNGRVHHFIRAATSTDLSMGITYFIFDQVAHDRLAGGQDLQGAEQSYVMDKRTMCNLLIESIEQDDIHKQQLQQQQQKKRPNNTKLKIRHIRSLTSSVNPKIDLPSFIGSIDTFCISILDFNCHSILFILSFTFHCISFVYIFICSTW